MHKSKIKSLVYKKFDGHCAYCGDPIDIKSMTIDHIHPSSLGGDDDICNLNPSCKTCNQFKSTLSLEEFRDEVQKQLNISITKDWFLLLTKYKKIIILDTPVVFYFEKNLNENLE